MPNPALSVIAAGMTYMKQTQEQSISSALEDANKAQAKWTKSEEGNLASFNTNVLERRAERATVTGELIEEAKNTVNNATQLIQDDQDREDMLDDFKSMELRIQEDRAAFDASILTGEQALDKARAAIEERVGPSDDFQNAEAEAYETVLLTAYESQAEVPEDFIEESDLIAKVAPEEAQAYEAEEGQGPAAAAAAEEEEEEGGE